MTKPIPAVEQAFHRYGEALFRLALLLCNDPDAAVAALVATARTLSASAGVVVDEAELTTALLASLSPVRRARFGRQAPVWARQAPVSAAERTLLARVAGLPQAQRATLGLLLVHGYSREQAAAVQHTEPVDVAITFGEALLALASDVPGFDVAILSPDAVPETCRPTRRRLAQQTAHDDPAARGHLALCPNCRAVERAWGDLASAVERPLRAALKSARMSEAQVARLNDVFTNQPTSPRFGHRARLALLPLAVLALIGLLVLPRLFVSNQTTTTSTQSRAPGELVDQALATLYRPPATNAWHGRWEILWPFTDGTAAMLNAEGWFDPSNDRHRIQLVHASGGAPYEFELDDGTGSLWYAIHPIYAPSLHPLVDDRQNQAVRLELPVSERQAAEQARLNSGAWGIAGQYLRQAQAAPDLRSWGRRRADDGAALDVVGYRGTSPLARPQDADQPLPTILLAIESESGRLREVNELLSSGDGQQVGRTTWRFAGGEEVQGNVGNVFNLQQAWNGTIEFTQQEPPLNLAFPLISAERVTPLVRVLGQDAAVLPNRLPVGVTSGALLLNQAQPAETTAMYLGDQRFLAVHTAAGAGASAPEPCDRDVVERGSRAIVLCTRPANGYTGVLEGVTTSNQRPVNVTFAAYGYTRPELIEILDSIGTLTVAGFRAQAPVFANTTSQRSAAFDALLGALAEPAALDTGAARHLTQLIFMRHNPQPDTLADPFHQLPYAGLPETIKSELWWRSDDTGRPEQVSLISDQSGELLYRSYSRANERWSLQLRDNIATVDVGVAPRQITPAQRAALTLLNCGGGTLVALPGDVRAVVVREADWSDNSCLRQNAAPERSSRRPRFILDPATGGLRATPFIADLVTTGQPLTAALYVGPDGRAVRYEIRFGEVSDGQLLESWEFLGDEVVPAERVAPDLFGASVPETATVIDDRPQAQRSRQNQVVRSATLTETATLAASPLFYLPSGSVVTLLGVEVASPQSTPVAAPLDSGVVNAALPQGVASRQTYLIGAANAAQVSYLYQGSEERFGSYLRRYARWTASEPVAIEVNGRALRGWKVTEPTRDVWLLFVLDGTLIALPANSAERDAMVTHLQRFAPPR